MTEEELEARRKELIAEFADLHGRSAAGAFYLVPTADATAGEGAGTFLIIDDPVLEAYIRDVMDSNVSDPLTTTLVLA